MGPEGFQAGVTCPHSMHSNLHRQNEKLQTAAHVLIIPS